MALEMNSGAMTPVHLPSMTRPSARPSRLFSPGALERATSRIRSAIERQKPKLGGAALGDAAGPMARARSAISRVMWATP